ncbi:MAG: flavodoxin family protein [Thermodesulfobacteria bacterium]|nr:flavodoxin family protein [Thermodesulfobacteriota bacterium]
MKVIAFNGSARKDGNTSILLRTVLERLEGASIETELVWLGNKPLGGCVACYKCLKNKDGRCAQDDIINEYLQKMLGAHGIILGSPTYFADVSANMKALIERCGMVSRVNGDLLKRKVGAAVVAVRRAGAYHVFSSLNSFFLIGQMIVVGSSYWNLARGKDPGEVKEDAEGMKTMTDLGDNMAWLLKKLNNEG